MSGMSLKPGKTGLVLALSEYEWDEQCCNGNAVAHVPLQNGPSSHDESDTHASSRNLVSGTP
jgi:hypothetical protein